MAKTIKFNLSCDGHPVRTLEDLREHFSMEDVLEYLSNGMLARWLDIRGYTAEKEQVEQITADNDRDRLWALVNIFDIDADQKEVTERAQQLDWKNRQKALSAAYQASGESRQQVLDDYFAGYENAVKTILENPDDYGIIQAAVADIDEHYRAVFDKGYMQLLLDIHEVSPLGAFTLLTRPHMRKVYLGLPKNDRRDIPKDERENLSYTRVLLRNAAWSVSNYFCHRTGYSCEKHPVWPIWCARKVNEKDGQFMVISTIYGGCRREGAIRSIREGINYPVNSILCDGTRAFHIFQGIEFDSSYDVYYMQI